MSSIGPYSGVMPTHSTEVSPSGSPIRSVFPKVPTAQVTSSKFFASASDDSDGSSSSSASPPCSPIQSDLPKIAAVVRRASGDGLSLSVNTSRANFDSYFGKKNPFIFEDDREGDDFSGDSSSPQGMSPISKFNNSLDEISIGDTLLSNERKLVEGAIEKLKSIEEVETKKSKVKTFLKGIVKKIVGGDVTPDLRSPKTQSKMHRSLIESPWASGVMDAGRKELRKSIPLARTASDENFLLPVVNMQHIVEGEEKKNKIVGCHFCPMGSPLRKSLVNISVNPSTGVFCAEILKTDSQEPKFSSFYPESIQTQNELLQVIQNAEVMMTEGNRSLRKTDKGFMIEAYVKNNFCIYSAFPIFFYAEYQKNGIFKLTENVFFTGDEVLKAGIDLMKTSVNKPENDSPIRYRNNDYTVIDIAFELGKKIGIKNGIYIRFPASVLTI